MKTFELKEALKGGALEKYSHLYSDIKAETERFISAIDAFAKKYGEDRDISIMSVPGRSEIIGNHTDHNRGKVLAGAINRDIIAVVSRNDDGVVRFFSEGYSPDTVDLSAVGDPSAFKKFTSRALVAGMAKGLMDKGYHHVHAEEAHTAPVQAADDQNGQGQPIQHTHTNTSLILGSGW